jgi:hypothetical protein
MFVSSCDVSLEIVFEHFAQLSATRRTGRACADLGVTFCPHGQAKRMTVDDLMTLREIDSPIDGHPNPALGFPFFDAATGSLGQGLSVAGVDDWHGMALGQHQAICTWIARLLRSPAHRVIHQRRDQMRKRERGGGMAAASGRSGPDRELGDSDCLGVNELAQRCHGTLL